VIQPKYHDCRTWEDWQHGMFRTTATRGDDVLLERSIALLQNQDALYAAMSRACNEWPIASTENLTKQDINRRAWLGWAACCINHKAPDIVTRRAWVLLSENERINANLIAERVIVEWEAHQGGEGDEKCQQLSLWT